MDHPEDKPAPKEYSFVLQEGTGGEQPGPLTLLRRSKRVLGDVDLGEASIPTYSGRRSNLLFISFIFWLRFLSLVSPIPDNAPG